MQLLRNYKTPEAETLHFSAIHYEDDAYIHGGPKTAYF